jgi:hypothetical protein
VFYPVVRPSNTCLLPHCCVPMDEGCTQPLSSDPMIDLNTMVFFFRVLFPFARTPQVGASRPYNIDHKRSTRVREGKQHTQDSIRITHMHTSQDLSSKTRRREFTTQTELKSLTQQSKCVETESRCLKMFRECLVFCSMHLGVPFIAPKQLGAIGDPIGRQFLPSVGWHTGQSSAPPDMNSTCPVPDLLPFLVQSTVGPSVLLAHRTLSGAHRIVQCAQPTVGAGHASLADCAADRWVRAPLAHRAVR